MSEYRFRGGEPLMTCVRWLTVLKRTDLDSEGVHHGWPTLWRIHDVTYITLHYITLHYISNDNRAWVRTRRHGTSMQRQGKGREYERVTLFIGSSFLIWKVIKVRGHVCVHFRFPSAEYCSTNDIQYILCICISRIQTQGLGKHTCTAGCSTSTGRNISTLYFHWITNKPFREFRYYDFCYY